jgi:hypothetical protein
MYYLASQSMAESLRHGDIEPSDPLCSMYERKVIVIFVFQKRATVTFPRETLKFDPKVTGIIRGIDGDV